MYSDLLIAKDAAISLALTKHHAHAYVYSLNGEYGVFSHVEDRYLMEYYPYDAKIIAHAARTWDGDNRIWTWEDRGSNITPEDREVLSDFFSGDLDSFLKAFIDDREE